jgi:hypothetical protein
LNQKTIVFILKTHYAISCVTRFYNAAVVAVNLKVLGLAPGMDVMVLQFPAIFFNFLAKMAILCKHNSTVFRLKMKTKDCQKKLPSSSRVQNRSCSRFPHPLHFSRMCKMQSQRQSAKPLVRRHGTDRLWRSGCRCWLCWLPHRPVKKPLLQLWLRLQLARRPQLQGCQIFLVHYTKKGEMYEMATKHTT